MTGVCGSKRAGETVVGTSGNDTLVAGAADETIKGMGGSDIVTSDYAHTTIAVGTVGDGVTDTYDTVFVTGAEDTITSGDADTVVVASGSDNRINLGNGSNVVVATGYGARITVGDGHNAIIAGPGAAVTVNASTVAETDYDTTVRFSGWGNSLTVTGGQQGLNPGTVSITGGTGGGTFNLQGASGTVDTDGQGNLVTAGTGTVAISAGSGNDRVVLTGGAYGTAGTATIQLQGWGNSVSGITDAATITGGSGGATVNLSNQPLGVSADIALGGVANIVDLTGYQGTVDAGSGQDTVALYESSVGLTLHGQHDQVFLTLGDNSVNDTSSASRFFVQAAADTVVDFTSFNAASGAVVDLLGSQFTSARQAFAALQSDGTGGVVLDLASGGSVHFQSAAHLTAANFKIM